MTTPLPTKHLVHLSNLLYGINPDQHRYYSLNPLGKPTSDNPQQQSQNPPPIPSAPPIPSVPLSEWTSFSDDIAFGMEAFETYLEPDQETRALLKTEVTSLRPPVIPRTTHSNGNALVLSRLLSQVLPAVNCLLEEGPTRFQHVFWCLGDQASNTAAYQLELRHSFPDSDCIDTMAVCTVVPNVAVSNLNAVMECRITKDGVVVAHEQEVPEQEDKPPLSPEETYKKSCKNRDRQQAGRITSLLQNHLSQLSGNIKYGIMTDGIMFVPSRRIGDSTATTEFQLGHEMKPAVGALLGITYLALQGADVPLYFDDALKKETVDHTSTQSTIWAALARAQNDVHVDQSDESDESDAMEGLDPQDVAVAETLEGPEIGIPNGYEVNVSPPVAIGGPSSPDPLADNQGKNELAGNQCSTAAEPQPSGESFEATPVAADKAVCKQATASGSDTTPAPSPELDHKSISSDAEDVPKDQIYTLVIEMDSPKLTDRGDHAFEHVHELKYPFIGPGDITNRHLPSPEQPLVSPPSIRLTLAEFRSQGTVWDCFTTSPHGIPGHPPLIVKLTDPRASSSSSKILPRVRNNVLGEAKLAEGALKELQGKVIPRFYGLFGSLQPTWAYAWDKNDIWASVWEDAGVEMRDEYQYNGHVKRAVLRLYNDLHAAGVVHGSVKWCHILKSGDQFRIVDLERATTRADYRQPEDFEPSCKEEINAVLRLFKC